MLCPTIPKKAKDKEESLEDIKTDHPAEPVASH